MFAKFSDTEDEMNYEERGEYCIIHEYYEAW